MIHILQQLIVAMTALVTLLSPPVFGGVVPVIETKIDVRGISYNPTEYTKLKSEIKSKALNGTMEAEEEFGQFIELLNQNCPKTFTNVKTMKDIINVCL